MSKIIGYALMVLFVCLLTFSSFRNATNHDEAANIVAGLSIWQHGSFELYSVNPPLVKLAAALPLLLFQPEVDWKLFDDHLQKNHVDSRPEFSLGLSFVRANLDNLRFYLFVSRLFCIPFALVGAYFCYRWASELYGNIAGLWALALWCFSPNVLTWGSMVMPDMAAAACGVMACYFFWKWLKNADYHNAFIAGVTLGLALLTKMTWVFLLPLLPLLWIVWFF